MWTEVYRPRRVADVVGNKSAVEQLQQWISAPPPYKPVLLGGPVGCGKTSLAHALFLEHDLFIRDVCALPVVVDDEKPNSVAHMVEELVNFTTAGMVKPGIIIDEVDNLEGHQRARLISVLKSRAAFPVPIVCICESVTSKAMEALKGACKVVRMFRPFSINKDVRTLLLRLQHQMALHDVSRQQLSMVEQVSQGDLRRATILLELVSRGRRNGGGADGKKLTESILNADAFTGSPFESTSSILYGVPRLLRRRVRQINTREVDEHAFLEQDGRVQLSGSHVMHSIYDDDERCDMMRDDIVVFMLHENYVDAVLPSGHQHLQQGSTTGAANTNNLAELNVLVEASALFADFDTLDSHFMHHTHVEARTCLAAGLPRPAEAALIGVTPKLQFTRVLAAKSAGRAKQLELSSRLPWSRQSHQVPDMRELVNKDGALDEEYASLGREWGGGAPKPKSKAGGTGESSRSKKAKAK